VQAVALVRENIETNFRAAVADLLTALRLPEHIVCSELAAMQPLSFAAASNRRVIGSINEFAWQLKSYMIRTNDPLSLSLQLSDTPMSAIGSKRKLGFPYLVARIPTVPPCDSYVPNVASVGT
jgi:hypothetical protein